MAIHIVQMATLQAMCYIAENIIVHVEGCTHMLKGQPNVTLFKSMVVFHFIFSI